MDVKAFLSGVEPGTKQLVVPEIEIGNQGFDEIFEFLKQTKQIISLKFNKTRFRTEDLIKSLGKNRELTIEGLEFEGIPLSGRLNFLNATIVKLPKISSLALQSCELEDKDSSLIKDILKTPKITKINLSINKFSNITVNEFLIVLQAQTHIKDFKIERNSIEIKPAILQDISRVLSRNRAISEPSTEPFANSENLPSNKTALNLKAITEKELEIERVRQKEKESQLFQLREVKKSNEARKKEVLIGYNNLLEESSLLKAENQALFQEFQLINRKNSRNNSVFIEKMHENNAEKTRLGLIQREEFEYLRKEQEKVIIDLEENFARNYKELSEYYRQCEARKRELDRHTLDLREESLNLSMRFEEELRELENRVALASVKDFEGAENQRNDEYLALKNDKKFNKLRNKELKAEIEKKTARNSGKLIEQTAEIYREKARINATHHSLSELNIQIENQKLEVLKADEKIDRVLRVLADLKREIEISTDEVKFELKREEETFLWEEELYNAGKEVLHGKILGLEEAIARKREENKRIKTEYKRLSAEVAAGLGHALGDIIRGQGGF